MAAEKCMHSAEQEDAVQNYNEDPRRSPALPHHQLSRPCVLPWTGSQQEGDAPSISTVTSAQRRMPLVTLVLHVMISKRYCGLAVFVLLHL